MKLSLQTNSRNTVNRPLRRLTLGILLIAFSLIGGAARADDPPPPNPCAGLTAPTAACPDLWMWSN